MSDKKKKKLTPAQQEYQEFISDIEPKRPVVRNCIRAFLVGGAICAIAQVLQWVFITYFNFDESTAGNPTSAVLIMVSVLLTGLGVFDHIGQWAGAGTSIPITGFANAMASAAIEHKTEGFVLGTAGNMFKIGGAVIVFGTFAAFVVAIIKFTFMWLGGM